MKDLFAPLLGDVVALARRAGEEISRHYRIHRETPVTPDRKVDGSPVTIADHASEAVLIEGLRRLAPSVPILSEEQVAKGVVTDISGGIFWCVDPLDGTKEYLGCTDEFTICVAGMVDFRPVFGVLHAPALDLTFGGIVGQGAFRFAPDESKTKIAVRARPASGGVALVSRSHGDSAEQKYLDDAGIAEKRVMGSAIKFGLIAAGEADLYVRFGPTCEWDTAAGQAVLDAAGGSLETFDGVPLGYGKPKFLNGGFVAKGK
jgi:3'(2'), 5'-bisphosphate nucleotidase